jgi:hypothetical protein
MKRTATFLVFVFALGCFGVGNRIEAEIVHIGLSGVGLYELPSEIAKRKGFY